MADPHGLLLEASQAFFVVVRRASKFMEVLFWIGLIVAWFALQKWVLPKLGVRT